MRGKEIMGASLINPTLLKAQHKRNLKLSRKVDKKMREVSRQRQWQRRQVKAGLCMICAKKQAPTSGAYCRAHLIAERVRQRARYHQKHPKAGFYKKGK